MSPQTAGRGEMPRSGEFWPAPPVEDPPSNRPIIGYVYELITSSPQLDSEHPYVGKTETTVHQRVHGAAGHTSPKSIAKDPWKARILPGRAGYRILERVRDTGEGDLANDAALRRAEAFWIDRLRTKYNVVRPVRPAQQATARPAARRAPTQAQLRAMQQQRRLTRRLVAFMLLVLAFTAVIGRVLLAMDLPWGAAPWVVAPAAGVLCGWAVFVRLDHALGVLTGRRAPRRRTRRSRSHHR